MKVYHSYKDKVCVALIALVQNQYEYLKPNVRKDKKITYPLWDKWKSVAKNNGAVTRNGGHGRTSLIEFDYLPEKYREDIKEKFGDPHKAVNPLRQYFKLDGEARKYYDQHPHNFLPEQVQRFTVNASTMQAVLALKDARTAMRKRMNQSTRGILESLINDLKNFKEDTKLICGVPHSLPVSNRLKGKIRAYRKQKYDAFVDMRGGASNPKKTTPEMEQLWNDMFVKRNHKPNYLEIWQEYNDFLEGKAIIVNTEENNGEVYDPTDKCFVSVSANTIANYLKKWENSGAASLNRNADRQKHMGNYKPWHRLKQPQYAGELISIDDRQPPFWYNNNRDRLWVYAGIDVGSQCITSWVFGESKQGIVLEFYRQMVRNYVEWDMPLPYELEAELNLNSMYTNSFLQPGVMFNEVRIEANKARAKRIENYWRQFRYGPEKKRMGWIGRPHAISEANQPVPGKQHIVDKSVIMQNCLQDIYDWNMQPHNIHKDMKRWEVQKKMQAPELSKEINWKSLLPGIGYQRKSSMNVGRIILNGEHHVVGLNGEVALGDTLLNIMKTIEGREVIIYFLDDNDGEMLKAHVHDMISGRFVCELMGDLGYERSALGRKRARLNGQDDGRNRGLMTAYVRTVDDFIKSQSNQLSRLSVQPVAEKPAPGPNDFNIRGLQVSEEQDPQDTEVLFDPNQEEEDAFEYDSNNNQNSFNPGLKEFFK